jgi:hypothetical protein
VDKLLLTLVPYRHHHILASVRGQSRFFGQYQKVNSR